MKTGAFLPLLPGTPLRTAGRVLDHLLELPGLRDGARMLHRARVALSVNANRRRFARALAGARLPGGLRPSVVISQLVQMGDIVACEPVVRHLRRARPDALLVFATHRAFRQLVDTNPDVDLVLPLTCIREWSRLLELRVFPEVVDLNMAGRVCKPCALRWQNPKGSHGVNFQNYFHYGSLLAAYAASAGLKDPGGTPRVFIPAADVEHVDEAGLPPMFACVHAGSNESIKMLPPVTWQRIVEHLNRSWGIPVVEIGRVSLTPGTLARPNVSRCGSLSILQSAEVIRRACLFIGTDSGPSHLANAVGTPGVILLGRYYHYEYYVPFSGDYANGRNAILVHHPGPVSDLPVEPILEAVDRRLLASGRTRPQTR